MALHVTRHAVARYCERIRRDATEANLIACLAAGKDKAIRKALRNRTAMIATGCCLLVCSKGSIVTVLPRR